MTRFFWLRHGPTHQSCFTGWRDVPADLSDTARLARIRAHLPPGAVVVSSDLSRAVATADAVMGGRVRLSHDARLREFDFGLWDGRHFAEIAAEDPDLSRRYWEAPGDVAPPGGESWNTAAARVEAAVLALAEAHPEGVVVVAHFGVILTQIARAQGITPAAALAQPIDPLSLSEIHLGPAGRVVVRVNDLL